MLKQSEAIDSVFKALSDAGRRRILEELTRGEAPMSALAEPLEISLSGVHQHVAVLEGARLVACEKRGRERWCRLDARGLAVVESWVSARRKLWEGRLTSLEAHLAQDRAKAAKKKGKRT